MATREERKGWGRVGRWAVLFAWGAAWTPAIADISPATFVANARGTAERLTAAIGDGTAAFAIVASLTSEVGPRLAGTPGDAAAVAWAEVELARSGFDSVRSEPVDVPRWRRGEAVATLVAPWSQPLVVTALGGSVPTPPGGIEAEVVAATDVEALKGLPREAIAGRLVYLGQRMQATRDGSGYGAAVPIRSRGVLEASRLGAAGLLIRSVGTGGDRFPHTGGMRTEDGVAKIPAAALAGPDADLVERALASGKPVRVRLVLTAEDLGTAPSANVLAEVRGRERPEEIVLLVAHLDSWDLGTGALDDGAGVAIAISAARAIAALPERPRRTIRVLLTANEEFGLSGARAYRVAHEAELARHRGGLEADLGAGPVWQLESRFAAADRPWAEAIHALVAPLGIELGLGLASGGADLSPLKDDGVPVLDLGFDATRYFDYHHTANDTLDKIDRAALAQSTKAFAIAAWALADLPVDLGKAPPPPAR